MAHTRCRDAGKAKDLKTSISLEVLDKSGMHCGQTVPNKMDIHRTLTRCVQTQEPVLQKVFIVSNNL